MNALEDLSERAWMFLAITSLPVPVSPIRKIAAWLFAILAMSCIVFFMAELSAMIFSRATNFTLQTPQKIVNLTLEFNDLAAARSSQK